MNQGWKTTEFWLTIGLLAFAMIAYLWGKIDWEKAIMVGSGALAIGGYSVGRGLSKYENVAKSLFPLLMVAVLMSGCAGWKTTTKSTLDALSATTKGFSYVIEPAYSERCFDAATACKKANDSVCDSLTRCQTDRDNINTAIKGIHMCIAAGYGFLAASNEEQTSKMISKAVESITLITEEIKKAGWVK